MKPDAVLFAPLVALGLLLALARGLGGQVPAPRESAGIHISYSPVAKGILVFSS